MIKFASVWKAEEGRSDNFAGSGTLDKTAAAMLGLPEGTRLVLFWRDKRNENEPDFDVNISCEDRDQSRDQGNQRSQANGRKSGSRW